MGYGFPGRSLHPPSVWNRTARGAISLRTQVQRDGGEIRFVDLKTDESEAVVYLTPVHVAAMRAQRSAVAQERLRRGFGVDRLRPGLPEPAWGPLRSGLAPQVPAPDVRPRGREAAPAPRHALDGCLVPRGCGRAPRRHGAVMRHRSYATTHQFYVEPSEEAQREAVRRLGKIFG